MTSETASPPAGLGYRAQGLFVRAGVLPLLLAASVIVFTALSDNFLTGDNLLNVARQSTYLIMVSMGQMLALLTGGFDLSVGSTISAASSGSATCSTFPFRST